MCYLDVFFSLQPFLVGLGTMHVVNVRRLAYLNLKT